MKTIYLHIGTPKSGTTALQFLFTRNKKLLAKHGCFYPTTGLEGWDAHYYLVASMLNPPPPVFPFKKSFEEYMDLLKEETKNVSKDIIISCEMFSGDNVDAKLLAKHLSAIADKVKVVVYLRRQDDLYQSWYSQSLKASWRCFTESIDSEKFSKGMSRRIDHLALCDKYAEAFGQENIIVRPYEKEQFVGGSIYSDFFNVMGLSFSDEYSVPEKNPNPSFTRDDLEFKRLVNCFGDLKLANKVGDLLPEYERQTNRAEIFRKHDFLSPADRMSIIEKYADDNSIIAKKYLGRADAVLFKASLPDVDDQWEPYAGISPDSILEIGKFIKINAWELAQELFTQISEALHSDDETVRAAAISLKPFLQLNKPVIINADKYFNKCYKILGKIKKRFRRLFLNA